MLCACVAIAVCSLAHHRVRADDAAWAELSDLTQYVPLVWAAGRTFQRNDTEGLARMTAAGVLTVGSSELLKPMIGRKRPDHEPGEPELSFPSGHVAKAWFAAAHLQRRYGCYELEWRCWRESAVPYLAAVITATARIGARRHHLDDVVASAVIAEAWVRVMTDRRDDKVRIAPGIDDGIGIAVVRRF